MPLRDIINGEPTIVSSKEEEVKRGKYSVFKFQKMESGFNCLW